MIFIWYIYIWTSMTARHVRECVWMWMSRVSPSIRLRVWLMGGDMCGAPKFDSEDGNRLAWRSATLNITSNGPNSIIKTANKAIQTTISSAHRIRSAYSYSYVYRTNAKYHAFIMLVWDFVDFCWFCAVDLPPPPTVIKLFIDRRGGDESENQGAISRAQHLWIDSFFFVELWCI